MQPCEVNAMLDIRRHDVNNSVADCMVIETLIIDGKLPVHEVAVIVTQTSHTTPSNRLSSDEFKYLSSHRLL